MAKRFTDSQIQSLKPTNKRAILFEDGGECNGSNKESFFEMRILVWELLRFESFWLTFWTQCRKVLA